VIVVRVRDQHVRDLFVAEPAHQRVDVSLVERAGIDHGDLAASEHVGAGAVVRER